MEEHTTVEYVPRETVRSQIDGSRYLREAREAVGLADFGDDAFLEPFEKLLDAAANETEFTERGLLGFEADMQRILVNRLRMQRDLTRHPEILDEDVSDPITIVGMVRTGTTKLQRVLACDPDVQSIPLWQILYTSPFTTNSSEGSEKRIEYAMSQGGFSDAEAAQEMQAGHPMILNAADEDILLFENTFEHLYCYMRNYAPTYWQWVQKRSPKPAYVYYKKILQYLQWQNGGKQGRPWVLKCTAHMSELETFFELFPNATVVHCHRNPSSAIPSYSRLQELSWMLRGTRVDPHAVGESMMDVWSKQVAKNLAARENLKQNYRIVDVAYDAIRSDIMSVVKEVFQAANRELSATAITQMQAWDKENVQHKFGKHQYSAEYFGLSKAIIEASFANYINQFKAYL